MMNLKRTLGVLLVAPFLLQAEVTLDPVFSDGMVLQRGVASPIWGQGTVGETVNVSFAGEEVEGEVTSDGTWRVQLSEMKASTQGRSLEVLSEGEKMVVEEVLVGDVWLCSGQSNMGFKLEQCKGGKESVSEAKDELIRVNDFRRPWSICTKKVAAETSGVAYHFARTRREADPDVPVGLLIRALSGSPIEHWTPRESLQDIEFCRGMMKRFATGAEEGDAWLEFTEKEDAWKKVERKEGRDEAGKRPKFEGDSNDAVLAGIYAAEFPGRLWRERVLPVAGYGIAGALWYQGERNTKGGAECASAYKDLLTTMITSWRSAWGQGYFRFLVVQLPTFEKGGPDWAVVQDAQAAAVSEVANADYINLQDLPDGGLHPPDKRPVGERLAAKVVADLVE